MDLCHCCCRCSSRDFNRISWSHAHIFLHYYCYCMRAANFHISPHHTSPLVNVSRMDFECFSIEHRFDWNKIFICIIFKSTTDKIILVNRMAIRVANPVFRFIRTQTESNRIAIAIGYSSLAFFHHSFVHRWVKRSSKSTISKERDMKMWCKSDATLHKWCDGYCAGHTGVCACEKTKKQQSAKLGWWAPV